MMNQNCGNCKYFRLYNSGYQSGECTYQVTVKIPEWFKNVGSRDYMTKKSGSNCPCHEPITTEATP